MSLSSLERTLSALPQRFRLHRIRDSAKPHAKSSMVARNRVLRRERKAAQRSLAKVQRRLEQQVQRVKAMSTDVKAARKAQARAERALEKKNEALQSVKTELKQVRRELTRTHRGAYESSTPGIPGWGERWRDRAGRRVLYVARRDYAGSMIEWARAVNVHTEYAARLATLQAHPFGYESDLIVKAPQFDTSVLGGREGTGLATLIAEADVIHIKEESVDLPSSGLRASWFLQTGKPVIFTCNGSHTRHAIADSALRAEFIDRLRPYAACVALTPDLLHAEVSSVFIPHGVNCQHVGFSWSDRALIAHSPSSLTSKGSTLFVAAMADVRRDSDVELDLIRDVPNAECVARKRRAGVFFDQAGVKLGEVVGWYGHSALEAAVAGVPVIAHLGDHALAQLRRLGHPMADDLMVINVQPSAEDLAGVILAFFRLEPEERLEKAIDTRAWVERHHDYTVVAGELAKLYSTALG